MTNTTPDDAKTSRADATRQRIIETAASLFAEHGYTATTVDELIRAVGLSKGAFFHHFESKRLLALTCYRQKQSEIMRRLLAGVAEYDDPLERLRAAIDARCDAVATDPALRCVLRLCKELADDPDLVDELAAAIRIPTSVIAGEIRAARARGLVSESVDAESAAESLFSGLVGLDHMSGVAFQIGDLKNKTRAFMAVFMRGMRS